MGLGVHFPINAHFHSFLLQVLFHQVGISQLHHHFVRDQQDLFSTELLGLFPHLADGVESEEDTVGGQDTRGLEDKLPLQMGGDLIIQIRFRHGEISFPGKIGCLCLDDSTLNWQENYHAGKIPLFYHQVKEVKDCGQKSRIETREKQDSSVGSGIFYSSRQVGDPEHFPPSPFLLSPDSVGKRAGLGGGCGHF